MRSRTCRRFSTEFKLGVVEAYLAGEGSLKGLATKAGVDHSPCAAIRSKASRDWVPELPPGIVWQLGHSAT